MVEEPTPEDAFVKENVEDQPETVENNQEPNIEETSVTHEETSGVEEPTLEDAFVKENVEDQPETVENNQEPIVDEASVSHEKEAVISPFPNDDSSQQESTEDKENTERQTDPAGNKQELAADDASSTVEKGAEVTNDNTTQETPGEVKTENLELEGNAHEADSNQDTADQTEVDLTAAVDEKSDQPEAANDQNTEG